MTYPPYGGQGSYGGYEPRPPTGYQPTQSYPVSGPLPTQGYPGSGPLPAQQPYSGVGTPEPPKPKRNGTMAAMLVAVIVLVALAGTFTALYFVESGKRSDTSAALEAKEKELTDAEAARKSAQDKAGESDRKLKDAEKARDEAKAEVADLTSCRDAARKLINAARAQKADLKAEIDGMFTECG
jgi:uncharacterized protein HemX